MLDSSIPHSIYIADILKLLNLNRYFKKLLYNKSIIWKYFIILNNIYYFQGFSNSFGYLVFKIIIEHILIF